MDHLYPFNPTKFTVDMRAGPWSDCSGRRAWRSNPIGLYPPWPRTFGWEAAPDTVGWGFTLRLDRRFYPLNQLRDRASVPSAAQPPR